MYDHPLYRKCPSLNTRETEENIYVRILNNEIGLRTDCYSPGSFSKNTFMKSILLFTKGGTEWLLIALVVLLLFGGKKIPELMKGLGKGINEFKKGKN